MSVMLSSEIDAAVDKIVEANHFYKSVPASDPKYREVIEAEFMYLLGDLLKNVRRIATSLESLDNRL